MTQNKCEKNRKRIIAVGCNFGLFFIHGIHQCLSFLSHISLANLGDCLNSVLTCLPSTIIITIKNDGIFWYYEWECIILLLLFSLALIHAKHQLLYSCCTIGGSFTCRLATSWLVTSNHIHAGVQLSHCNLTFSHYYSADMLMPTLFSAVAPSPTPTSPSCDEFLLN